MAAVALGNAFSVLAAAFPDGSRGTAMTFWGVSAALSYVTGPLIAGAVAQHSDWRLVFVAIGASAALGAALGHLTRSISESRNHRRYDLPGAVMLTLGLSLVVAAMIEGNQMGWGSLLILACAAGGAALLVALVLWERRALEPMLDPSVLKAPGIQTVTLATLVFAMCLFAAIYYLAGYFRVVLGARPLDVAVKLLGLTVPCLLGSLITLRLRRVFPPARLIVVALGGLAVGGLLVARLGPESTYPSLLPGLVVFGVALGSLSGPIAAVVEQSVGPDRSGLANAFVYTCRPVGAAIGIAGFGALFQARVTATLGTSAKSLDHARTAEQAYASGVRTVFVVLAALAAISAAWCVVLVRRQRAFGTPQMEASAPPATLRKS